MADLVLTPRMAALHDLQTAILEPQLKKLGMSWATFQLLVAVQSAGEAASQAEVARRLGVAPATLSESVSSHVKKGLLAQVPSVVDRRVKVLELTGKANKAIAAAMQHVNQLESIMRDGLSDSAASTCAKALDRCITNLERHAATLE